MKRIIHTYVILCFSLLFLSCEDEELLNSDNYLYPEMGEWFDYLCSLELGGRYSGSEGIKKAEKYICDIIGRDESLICDHFQTSKCEMTNIIYHFEGKCDSLIVIGAHYDAFGFNSKTPLPGADDNLSGVAVLLNTIKSLQLDSLILNYSLDFCFFDGEEIGRYGSKHYVENNKQAIKFYINIDTCGNPYVGLGMAYSAYSPYLALSFTKMLKELNMITGEYDPVGYTTDCEPFVNKKIPFVSIGNESFRNYQHTFNDNVTNISFSRINKISKSLYEFLKFR